MNPLGLFIIGTLGVAAASYFTGRFLLPRMFVFPIPAWHVGLIVFGGLTGWTVLRTVLVLFSRPRYFSISILTEAYAEITIVALCIVWGYDTHKLRHPKSIKGSLAVAPDGGLHILDPFTAPEDVALGKTPETKPPK